MFSLRNVPPQPEVVWMPNNVNIPSVIEGGDLLDTVCPISKQTGMRENALSLLTKVLNPKQQNLIDGLLQYLPTVNEVQGITDDDALDMIVSRFDQGTPYENDLLRDRLASSLDVLLPRKQQSSSSIEFESNDSPVVSKEPAV